MLKKENYYIMKHSDGTVWNFTYNKKMGIICKVLKGNRWSNCEILIKECNEKFQVTILPDENIYLFYKDLSGNIKLKIHDKTKWKEGQIIQGITNEMYEGNFNITPLKNEIHIVYSILNKKTNKKTLFYQKLGDQGKLSDPEIIDTIYPDYNIPIVTVVTLDNKLYVMYGKLAGEYKIGYKILNLDTETWSEFYVIDSAEEAFADLSFTFTNNTVHAVGVNNNDVKLDKGYKKDVFHEKIIREKEQLITDLKYKLEDQKVKNLSNENKLNEIKDDFKKFKENKELLNESINLLQERLIAEANKNTILEKRNMEMEGEILALNKENEILQEINTTFKSYLADKNFKGKIE